MPPAPEYGRPEPTEYAAFYAGYVGGVPEGNLLDTLARQGKETAELLGSLPVGKADYAYAPGKWTIKEVAAHMADAERVMTYRALRIARGDQTPLPGFDENAWAPLSGAGQRTMPDLIEELSTVRAATLTLFRHLPEAAPTRKGTANNASITVRALAWIVAGHERHHLKVLRERYL
ncbi:MAG: DinB family protein [Gemmatimonadales bacterium]|nr:DinB family protein [Gemmatimonadales bacterium]